MSHHTSSDIYASQITLLYTRKITIHKVETNGWPWLSRPHSQRRYRSTFILFPIFVIGE
jgi:hypothetical protein